MKTHKDLYPSVLMASIKCPHCGYFYEDSHIDKYKIAVGDIIVAKAKCSKCDNHIWVWLVVPNRSGVFITRTAQTSQLLYGIIGETYFPSQTLDLTI